MLNKIMVDGIDVSECQNYNSKNKKCRIPFWVYHIKFTGCRCSEVENCYYKQLKRKEQEINELKNDYAELEKECEELKTQLKQVKYLYEVQDEKLIDELATENKQYKQALDEIEKLIKEALDPEKTETEQSFDNFYKCLDIINKAKEQ